MSKKQAFRDLQSEVGRLQTENEDLRKERARLKDDIIDRLRAGNSMQKAIRNAITTFDDDAPGWADTERGAIRKMHAALEEWEAA